MNPSIDRIVFQIEQLGGVINELSYSVSCLLLIHSIQSVFQLNEAVGELSGRAQETVQNLQDEFTSNKTGVPDMLVRTPSISIISSSIHSVDSIG